MRPTSLLTNIGVFGGLLSTALTPLFGAIVDHTPHRLHVGRISASILSVVKGVEAFVGRSTWPAVAALQVANMAVYNAYLVAAYAYTAELTRMPDDQTAYNSRFQMVYYVSMLAFLVSVMTVSACLGFGDVGTARVSQGLAFAACASAFYASWGWFFRPRPALSDVPPGGSLARSGYDRLSSTLMRMRTDDRRRAVRCFLLSASLSEAATSALATISTTYMSHVLEMNARQIGTAFLCVFVAGIPGSRLGGLAGSRLNPLRSAMLCLVLLVANTTAAASVMRGPGDRGAMYAFSSVWGVCLAWLHPTHASLYCTIIPRGQEGEVNYYSPPHAFYMVQFDQKCSLPCFLRDPNPCPPHRAPPHFSQNKLMGIYIFSGSVLAWLPPFLFSFLNEIGASMTIGLASLNLFFVGGFALLLMIGNYDEAVALAQVEDDGVWTTSHGGNDGGVVRNIPELT